MGSWDSLTKHDAKKYLKLEFEAHILQFRSTHESAFFLAKNLGNFPKFWRLKNLLCKCWEKCYPNLSNLGRKFVKFQKENVISVFKNVKKIPPAAGKRFQTIQKGSKTH
mgnify:CR=1 FL=1